MHIQTALESLTKNKNVIRQTDKNGSIVALEKEKYEQVCFNILIDASYYEDLNEYPNTSYKEDINLHFMWIYMTNSKASPWKIFT